MSQPDSSSSSNVSNASLGQNGKGNCNGQPTVPSAKPSLPSQTIDSDTKIDGPNISVWLASHVTTQDRIQALKRCLDSAMVGYQTSSTDGALLISWSAESKKLKLATQRMLNNFSPDRVKAIYQPEPMSQFQHYQYLSERTEVGHTTDGDWVMFSDDDDLWHPKRTSFYAGAISQALQANSDIHALYVPCCAQPAEDGANKKIATAQDVTRLIKTGQVRITRANEEHWEFAVTRRLLRSFFQQTPLVFLRHKFCDVRLVTFINQAWGKDLVRKPDGPGQWLYYWSCSDHDTIQSAHSSTSAHASQRVLDIPSHLIDMREAVDRFRKSVQSQGLDKLFAGFGGAFADALLSDTALEKEAKNYISSALQNIDNVLVRYQGLPGHPLAALKERIKESCVRTMGYLQSGVDGGATESFYRWIFDQLSVTRPREFDEALRTHQAALDAICLVQKLMAMNYF